MDSGIFHQPSEQDPFEFHELLAEIRQSFSNQPEELIPILQKVQQRLGYLPESLLVRIARFTRLPSAAVFGVATFYEQFRFHPPGRHTIRVCRGTACHVRGASQILDEIKTSFHLAPGKTSPDSEFTLETVACFGSCALAPVVLVDDSVKGRMNPSKTRKELRKIKNVTDPS